MDSGELKTFIRQKAEELGFAACGFTDAGPWREIEEVNKKYLKRGYQAGMTYLVRHAPLKLSAEAVLKNAGTVISLAGTYPVNPDTSTIAAYALGTDYHIRFKEKLNELAFYVNSLHKCKYRVCVDTCPLPERFLAWKAGLGWIGKSGNFIVKGYGPNVHLGEIILDFKLSPDLPASNECGDCDLCIKSCPVNAIKSDGFVDANLCLSYHTVESRQDIPLNLATELNGRFFGCETCVSVCPYLEKNEFFNGTPSELFTDEEFLVLPELSFKKHFKNTAVERSGKAKTISNWAFAVATGNYENKKSILEKALNSTSGSKPENSVKKALSLLKSKNKSLKKQ